MDTNSTFGVEPERLKRLLSASLEDSDFEDDAVRTMSLELFAEKSGSRIGQYKLLNVLGEGGMGIVYLAEQVEPIRRQVALKVIKPGMDSKRVIARFEAERQTLALLDHPNIACVYDAGTTEAGRPYFVMEYVKGLPITEYCDQQKLTIEERLGLFLQVCHAVYHAHQKGIIHRDIKPSNIVVSTRDGRATPKIIDFGVAKATSQLLSEQTLVTLDNQLLGTPEYMSPEQVDMTVDDIDTRSDIYSLGVLLYVLLTGVLPFDSKDLRKSGIEQIRRTICEIDPKTPSTRLSSLGEKAENIAESRQTEVSKLAKRLQKELEWIPLKAMRKERSERYRSASELADDIENYLKGDPLIAGLPGKGYRLKKFVRRNRMLVGCIAAVLVVLVAGVLVSTILAIGQARAHVKAQLVADFLENDVLGSASKARVGEATLSFALDAASERLDSRFRNQPLIKASLHQKLGATYRSLGESTKAEPHIERAYEIRRQQLGPEHRDTIESVSLLGWVYRDQGRLDDAERLWTEQLEIVQLEYGREHKLTLGFMNSLASTYTGQGRYKDAEALYDRILETARRNEIEEDLFMTNFNLGTLYRHQGRYEEAERLLSKTLEICRQQWGPENRWALIFTTQLSVVYHEQGRYKEAQQLCETTLDTTRRVLGNEHRYTLGAKHNLARIYMDQGSFTQAEDLLSEVLDIQHRQLGEGHQKNFRVMNSLAVLYTKQKRYDEAEPFFKKALEGRTRYWGEVHPRTLESKNDLAILYKEQARYEEAEELLLEALKGRRLKVGDTHPHTLQSLNNLIDLYEAWNRPEKAEEQRAKLAQKKAVQE